MARHVERLDGGLRTAEDVAFLEPGELVLAQNLTYLPGTRGINRARGRSDWGSATGAANVDGLRDIEFDNGDHYLVALVSSLYRYGQVADTASAFATLTATQAGDQLERIQFRNRYYLLNGVTASVTSTGTNFVAYLSATAAGTAPSARQHGLLPVISAPFASSTAGTFSQTTTGYYEYWTTEVAKLTQDGADLILESAFAAETNPTTVFVSSTGMYPIIHRPPVRNPITTHWRIYRSPKKDKESDKKFPSGFLISTDLSTATAQFPDTQTVVSASAFPGSFNSGSQPFSGWTTSATLSADDGVYASASAASVLGADEQGCYAFNFGGFSGSVKGVAVEFQGYRSGGSGVVPVVAMIGKRDTDGNFTKRRIEAGPLSVELPIFASKNANVSATVAGTPQTITLGGQNDRWFASDQLALADSDFDTNFMLVLGVSQTGVTLGVDYAKVYVYYAAAVDSTVPYPSIVYTFGDIVSQVSKNHPPPSASTGDIFEDSLVLNDVNAPSLIRWSFPGEPEYFPPTYFLDFETNENDRVRLVKMVNSTLVVMLDSSSHRINYLPSERDASFDRGKASSPISTTYGCVNPMCAASFSMDGAPEMLAFVSDSGIHATDGHSFDTYSEGLDWREIISASSTSSPICLINDRERKELLFYYRNDANGNETYLCLHANYATDHLVNGKPKFSGPVHMRNYESGGGGYASLESAWAIQRSTGATDVFLGYGGASAAAGAGHVYRETGTTIPANDSTCKYVTRRMYLAGFGNEWVGNEVYGYCGSYSGSPVISYVAQNAKTNDAGPGTVYTKNVTLGGQRLHKISPRATFEGMQLTATVTATSFAQECLVIEGEGWGEEDSGR